MGRIRQSADLMPDHPEARLATALEVFLEPVEREQEDLLKLVEAAVDLEPAPMEALVEVQVSALLEELDGEA